MAVTQNPLIGRTKKSFSQNTFYTMNGQNIVRSKAIAVSNPRTPAQVKQRVRFAAFTEAANSLPENELNALIPTKQLARNRRSTLQSQLAPAYGAMQNPQSGALNDFIPTFDITKVGDLGTSEVGYIGELVECIQGTAGVLSFDPTQLSAMIGNLVNTVDTDNMAMVVIAEDGCVLQVLDTNLTLAGIKAIQDDNTLELPTSRFNNHGTKVYAYLTKKGDKLQLIGLGTFTVAKRTTSTKHNTPV